jgi:hypothetical protein
MVGSGFVGLALVEEYAIDLLGFDDLGLMSLFMEDGVIERLAFVQE